MNTPLNEAPFDRPLTLVGFSDAEMEARFLHLGLERGRTLVRENEEILLQPVRVRTPQGEAVLGGRMAMQVIVHLGDGRRMPLSDLHPGQSGHIEGTSGRGRMAEVLLELGLRPDAPVTFIRKLPPMDYTVRVDRNRRERITEGLAAKIGGRIGDRPAQFVSAGKGQPFRVEKILGGERAAETLAAKGIVPGRTIALEAVAPAQTVALTTREPVVITTDDGLHLHLRPGQARRIRVEQIRD
jgi:Fe2+ transport system protein FeoA